MSIRRLKDILEKMSIVLEGDEQFIQKESNFVNVKAINKQLKEASVCHYASSSCRDLNILTLSTKELKRICRSGLNHKIRGDVWIKCSRALEDERTLMDMTKADEDVFKKNRITVSDLPSVPLFGSTNLEFHNLTAEGIDQVAKTCCCISYLNPDVDYCPILPHLIAACLLYTSPEHSFCIVQSMIKASRAEGWYFQLHSRSFAIVTETFLSVAEKKISSVFKHIQSMNCVNELRIAVREWFGSGFAGLVPRYAYFRIMDAFVLEGVKIFFRVGISLLGKFKDDLRKSRKDNFLSTLKKCVSSTNDTDSLLRKGFRLQMSRKGLRNIENRWKEKIHDLDLPKAKVVPLEFPNFSAMESFLPIADWLFLWHSLPRNLQNGSIKLLFSTRQHGYAFRSFHDQCKGERPRLLLVKDSFENMFGMFLSRGFPEVSCSIADRSVFLLIGSSNGNERGIFRRNSNSDSIPSIYLTNQLFSLVCEDSTVFLIGTELMNGSWVPSNVFGNLPLNRAEEVQEADKHSFAIVSIELWSLEQ